jgi:hypothetical protein
VPEIVTGLVVAQGQQALTVELQWQSLKPQAGDGVLYDVIQGSVSQLPLGGLQSSSCAISGVQQESVVLNDASPPGDGSWFLLRGANVCGNGTYDSGGPGQDDPRPVGACP